MGITFQFLIESAGATLLIPVFYFLWIGMCVAWAITFRACGLKNYSVPDAVFKVGCLIAVLSPPIAIVIRFFQLLVSVH